MIYQSWMPHEQSCRFYSWNFLFAVKSVTSFVPKATRKCGQFTWKFSVVSEFAGIVNIAYISGPDPMKRLTKLQISNTVFRVVGYNFKSCEICIQIVSSIRFACVLKILYFYRTKKTWKPEIFIEYCCVARKESINLENIKPQER